MNLLSKPGHKNILPIIDYMQDSDFIYIVMPYLGGGDLFSKVKERQECGLSEDDARRYFRQIVGGLLYMKEHCLVHGDLSTENFVMDSDGSNVSIIDFGMCLRIPERNNQDQPVKIVQANRGKLSFIPPEVYYQKPSDGYSSDVWSLSICLYIMLVG